MEKFEYEIVLKKGPQLGAYADFPFDSQKIFGTRKAIPVKVDKINRFFGYLARNYSG